MLFSICPFVMTFYSNLGFCLFLSWITVPWKCQKFLFNPLNLCSYWVVHFDCSLILSGPIVTSLSVGWWVQGTNLAPWGLHPPHSFCCQIDFPKAWLLYAFIASTFPFSLQESINLKTEELLWVLFLIYMLKLYLQHPSLSHKTSRHA